MIRILHLSTLAIATCFIVLSKNLWADPGLTGWEGRTSLSNQSFRQVDSPWRTVSASLKRDEEFGSLAAEIAGVERYDKWGERLGLDGYAKIWPRAYLNVWMQGSMENPTLPLFDYRGELYQGLAIKLETSIKFRQIRFKDATVEIFGVGCSLYSGFWYWRLEGSYAIAETGSFSTTLTARRFTGDAGDFSEFKAGFGSTEMSLGERKIINSSSDYFASYQIVKTLFANSGGILGITLGRENQLGEFLSIDAGIFFRFGASSTKVK